jgi:predicted transcriptional regulator
MDEAIIDYLSKKAVTDQTEQLALARISSKAQISTEEAQRILERLCAKDWIRRYKMPGKVTFELTPKGKAGMEAYAKARRERITNQLQQAIQQQRKAKLRTNLLNKMISIDDKWKNYEVPDKNQMDSVGLEAERSLGETKEAQARQPICHVSPQGYDQEFQHYKTQIENIATQNNNIYKVVNKYVQIKLVLLSISADVEKISKTIMKYEPEPEASAQINKLKTSLTQLKQTQSQLETFGNDQLSQLEELKTKLAENTKILETLRKPTHEFIVVKREAIAEITTRYPDPELPIIHDRQTSRGPLEEKCVKCGTKRKSTPVNIG